MNHSFHPSSQTDEVDELIRNAELRTELEPFYDEAISRVNVQSWTLRSENEFLASMLNWEKAPVLPIYQWFDPPLELPAPCLLTDETAEPLLMSVLEKLYQKGIVLDHSDHLANLELYALIYNEILPMPVKKIDNSKVFQHWSCCNRDDDENILTWLSFYASDEERDDWQEQTGLPLPAKRIPFYSRGFYSNTDL